MLSLLSYFIGNSLGLFIANLYIPGFEITTNPKNLAFITLLLTFGNIIIRPILKLIFAPLIWLTLGLFIVAINALILFTVDFISDLITINGLAALIYSTLLISLSVIITKFCLRRFFPLKPI